MKQDSTDYGNDNTIAVSNICDGQLVVRTSRVPGDAGYETMVFSQGARKDIEADIDADKYSTLQEAQLGHEEITSKWQDAKSVYCFDCGNDWANRSWLLSDGHTYCLSQRNGSHRVCSECMSACPCKEHPNWCIECQTAEPCEHHREEEV